MEHKLMESASIPWMKETQELAALTELLSKAVPEARRLLGQFKVTSKTKDPKLLELFVLNEIVRKCQSVATMSQAGTWSGISVVTRSAFESYADLLNLLQYNSDYVNYMVWASLNQQRSQFQAILSNPDSRYAKALQSVLSPKNSDAQRILTETIEQMAALADDLPDRYKYKSGEVNKSEMLRFELAGKLDEYNALYRRMSGGVHGRLSDMSDGIMDDDGNVNWPPADQMDPPLMALGGLCEILLESSYLVAKAYRKPLARLNKLVREHAAVKQALSETAKARRA